MKKYIRSTSIFAMSFPRKIAHKHLSKNSESLCDHVLKCILFADIRPDQLYHWIHEEICGWLEDASEVKCDSKLKSKDYLETVFCEFGTDKQDAKVVLKSFRKHYCFDIDDSYPDFDITIELVDKTYKIFQTFIDVCMPLLLKKDPVSQDDWYKAIHDILLDRN